MSKEHQEIKTELSRELTLFQLTMMGLGMMIGAGVFLGIGNAIHHAGPGGVMLTFGLNGILALFTAMSYAELSSAIPRAGGAFNFARLAFGNGTSFLAGWMEWFASSIAGSMYAITFSIYTLRYFETLGWLPPELSMILTKPVAIAVALIFIFINFKGVSETGKIGAIMTLGQTLFLVFIAAAGIFVAIKDPQRLANFNPYLPYGWGKLLMTMGFTYVAFEGYEVIAQAGDEAIAPRENLPKAMILSVTIAALTYIGVSFAAIVAVEAGSPGIDVVPWKWIGAFGEKGFGEAIARLIPAGNILLTVAVIFASTSALNSTIFSATRASYALGRDQMLPPIFAKISKKRKTPSGALLCTAGIIIVVAAFLPTMDVASSASIMFLFLFFLVNLSAIRVRNHMGDELHYGFLTPLFPLFPILAVVLQAALAIWLVHMSYIAWIVGPSWIVLGIVIYHAYAKHHVSLTEDDIHILYEEKCDTVSTNRITNRIMIPIANPNNVPMLVDMAKKISKTEDSTIELLHMIPVPDQLALKDAEPYVMVGKKGLLKAAEMLDEFTTSTTVRYCRNIARGIVSTALEKRATMIVMGWHGKRDNSLFSIGSTLDPVICRAPCNVIVTKDDIPNRTYKTILVPLFGNVNDALAMKTAEFLLPPEGGTVTALYFNAARMRPGHIHNILNRIIDNPNIEINEIASNSKGRDQVKTILEETAVHDLMILGIKEPKMHRLGRPSASERIAQSCDSPFLLVKANSPIRRLAKRWF